MFRNPLRIRFVRDVALTGGTQVIQAACAMVGGILVARLLGPDDKGALSVLVALGSLAVLIASFGVHQSAIYFMGRFKSDRETIVSNNLVFGLTGGIATAVVLGAVGLAFREQLLHEIALGLFLLYLIAVPFNYFNEFARRIGLGAGNVGMFNLPDLVGGASLLFGTTAAIAVFGEELLPLVVLRVGTELVIAVALLLWLRRLIALRLRPSRVALRQQLSYGLRNYASSLLWIFLLQSDLILCNAFLGTEETGIYSVAISLGLPVTMLGAVIGTLVFQRVAADESRDARIANTNRVVRLLVPIATLAVTTLGVLSGWIVPLVYGDAFDPAGVALVLLLPGLLMLCLETVLMNFLAGEGSPPVVVWAPLAGLVVNITANLFMIPAFGINGASITSSVGYAVVFLLVLRYYLRFTGSGLRTVLLPARADLRTLLRHPPASTPAEVRPA